MPSTGFNKGNACRWFFFVMGAGSAPEQAKARIRFVLWRCLLYWTFFPLFSKLLWPEHQSQWVSTAWPAPLLPLLQKSPRKVGPALTPLRPCGRRPCGRPRGHAGPWHLTAVRSSRPALAGHGWFQCDALRCGCLCVCSREHQCAVLLDTHPESQCVQVGYTPRRGIFLWDCLFYWCWAVWVHSVFWILTSHWIDHLQISSHSVGCFFVLLMVSFVVQQLFNSM